VTLTQAAIAKITGKEAAVAGYFSWTDAVNLIERGIPAVVLGAGSLGVAHSDEEWVMASDLLTLSQILVAVVESWHEGA
jgi:acetylornithine deacetylase/succinyl-diaminopimelate desuccinylase-like protein